MHYIYESPHKDRSARVCVCHVAAVFIRVWPLHASVWLFASYVVSPSAPVSMATGPGHYAVLDVKLASVADVSLLHVQLKPSRLPQQLPAGEKVKRSG